MRKLGPSDIRVEGDIAFVKLTQGQESIIDADDVDRVSGHRWHAIKRVNGDGDRFYAGCGSLAERYLHRFVARTGPTDYIDHLNGDGLDNRKSNLRFATNQQNAQNKQFIDPRSKTGHRGVSTNTIDGRTYYVAKVSVTRYFPLTDEGFEQAVVMAGELRERLKQCGLM